jgi:hypothetical protein
MLQREQYFKLKMAKNVHNNEIFDAVAFVRKQETIALYFSKSSLL